MGSGTLGRRMGRGAVALGFGLAMALAAAGSAVGSPASGDPYGIRTPADPHYALSLVSDADGFVWAGTERISFVNADPDPLTKIWLRLWDNEPAPGCGTPRPIKVSHVRGGSPGALDVDCTALPITLPHPLDQGNGATISFAVRISVPDTNWRFGRIGSLALVGNAVPILAIHDAFGWHLDPYTSNGESFYSLTGDFSVTFATPKAIRVAATGTVVSSSIKNGTRTTRVEADDVRDFAWASGPLSEEEGYASTGVRVRVWWEDPITKAQADFALTTGEAAMAFHADAFGPYPYGEVDIVLGNFTRFGGMEYPQLVMSQASGGVIVHELGHQWWFGIEGDDEYAEPWLDEAFATYATDLFYGHDGEGCTLNWPSDGARVTNSMAYWDEHPTEYFTTVYGIGSCSLHDLGRKLGTKAMAAFIHAYAVEHALGFSTTDAFKDEAQSVADGLPHPVDLARFWKKHRIDDVP